MRRGGTLHPPRPRAPAATRPAPLSRPSEGQVFHTDSCDLKDQEFWEAQGLPTKGADLWNRKGARQTLPWGQQCPKSRGKRAEPSAGSGKEPQPQAEPVF